MVCPYELEKLIFSLPPSRAKWMPGVEVFVMKIIAGRDMRTANCS